MLGGGRTSSAPERSAVRDDGGLASGVVVAVANMPLSRCTRPPLASCEAGEPPDLSPSPSPLLPPLPPPPFASIASSRARAIACRKLLRPLLKTLEAEEEEAE